MPVRLNSTWVQDGSSCSPVWTINIHANVPLTWPCPHMAEDEMRKIEERKKEGYCHFFFLERKKV
jgi:hypothetical protein